MEQTDNNDYVLLQIEENGIANLILNRPEKSNAFNDEMINKLIDHLHEIEENKDIKVVILKATGKSFSAGADLAWMRDMINYNRAENYQDALQLARLLHHLYHLNKPTIALIQGSAYGGALGLIACCDIAIATVNTQFCLSEVKLGLIPATIMPYLLQAIHQRQLRRYCLTSELIPAETALSIGLIHELCNDEKSLQQQGLGLANHLMKNDHDAIIACKHYLQEFNPISDATIDKSVHTISERRVSASAQQRMKNFLDQN